LIQAGGLYLHQKSTLLKTMKKIHFSLPSILFLWACLFAQQAQAQLKGVVKPQGLMPDYEVSQILNGTKDGKIKTIELPQINDNFDKKPYHETTTKYLYAVNGWKKEGFKANILGILNIENGMIYFYTLVTPSGQYQVRYGVLLVRNVSGEDKLFEYDTSEFMPELFIRPNDATYKTESVVIKVKSTGKNPSFTIVKKGNTGTFETSYTLSPAEADTNNKWIETFSKNKK
jgi:hypothetical protein